MTLLLWALWLLRIPTAVVITTATIAPEPYRITFYCSCQVCTGPGGPKRTAYGYWPREGRTVAADPRLHKHGEYVTIEGLGRFRVEDTGSAIRGRRLDVYMRDHARARRAGVQWRKVR